MRNQPRLLYFARGEDSAARPSFQGLLEQRGWRVDCVAISDGAPARGILSILRDPHRFSDYDVVAASEYFLTWALCLRLLFTPLRPRLAALSFNQSSQKLVRTGFVPADRLLNRIWRRVTIFHVHSQAEARLFARLHDIPADRFTFSRWGYDLPKFNSSEAQRPTQPYVTMVGRNNRDLATFCSAVEQAGVHGVLITAGYMVERYPIEPNEKITVLVDRPGEECLNYVAGSFAHLVLVTDAERGAGHISAVTAMLLGKPQVFSDVEPLADYLINDFNGVAVPIADVGAVAEAIGKLRTNSDLAHRLGAQGRTFALKTMSDASSAAGVASAVIRALGGKSKEVGSNAASFPV